MGSPLPLCVWTDLVIFGNKNNGLEAEPARCDCQNGFAAFLLEEVKVRMNRFNYTPEAAEMPC